MPRMLYRYILTDLLRIIGLTTLILVTVIAFGATIKPLATDVLLDARQTIKYMGLAVVPMLQFALPFAAGFGATLTFFRLTTDNEIQAMAASGISYRRILLPVVALGVALMLIMVVLTQWVIPQFWTLIVQTVATDVTKLFQVSIQRGEPFQVGKLQIYADRLVVQDDPEGPDGPDTRMFLVNVAAADLDDAGRILTDVTASNAVVDVYRREGQTYLKMVMTDTVALNAQTGHLVQSDRIAPPRAIAVPSALKENAKALSRTQMLALRKNPDSYGPVAAAREALADTIRDARMQQTIDQELRTSGQLELVAENPGGLAKPRRYVIHADRMIADGRFVSPLAKGIEIVLFEGDQATVRFLAESAQLTPAASAAFGSTLADLTLGNHEVVNLLQADGMSNKRGRLVIPNLSVTQESNDELASMSSRQLIEQAQNAPSARDRIKQRVIGLTAAIDKLYREINGRLLNRYALSVTALLLLVLGAVLPMWRRSSLPLTTYVLAFVPSVADLIMISAGEQLLRDGRIWGHLVMWAGNALLLVLILAAFVRTSRH